MATEAADSSGPDLGKGIPARDLRDGSLLVGHVAGEAVCLARNGQDVFAVSAKCTHYGGPLGEGLLVGDTLRCPWHHARFCLRTGAVLAGPALDPIACWQVEQRGDQLIVIGKRPPAQQPAASSQAGPIVILGGGAAGHVAAETLRREGYAGKLSLLSADPAPPVDRPNLSKDYLAGNAPEEWIPLRPREFYAEHQIALETGVRVERVDIGAKKVALSNGTTLGYGALLLATGADPVRLMIPGGTAPHVH